MLIVQERRSKTPRVLSSTLNHVVFTLTSMFLVLGGGQGHQHAVPRTLAEPSQAVRPDVCREQRDVPAVLADQDPLCYQFDAGDGSVSMQVRLSSGLEWRLLHPQQAVRRVP